MPGRSSRGDASARETLRFGIEVCGLYAPMREAWLEADRNQTDASQPGDEGWRRMTER